MRKVKNLYVGDVLYMPPWDETIEILGGGKPGEVLYWSSRWPHEFGTPRCRGASLWVVFKYGKFIFNVDKVRRK